MIGVLKRYGCNQDAARRCPYLFLFSSFINLFKKKIVSLSSWHSHVVASLKHMEVHFQWRTMWAWLWLWHSHIFMISLLPSDLTKCLNLQTKKIENSQYKEYHQRPSHNCKLQLKNQKSFPKTEKFF